MHYRKQIRDAVYAKLNGHITSGALTLPFFRNRAIPFWEMELPVGTMYMLDDPVDHKSTAPRRYYHEFALVIEFIFAEETGAVVDDQIDDVTDQVELIMDTDPFINDLVDNSELKGTKIAMKEQGDKLFMAAIMTYNIKFQTDAPREVAAGAVVDMETSNTGMSTTGNPDETKPDIEAEIELRT